MLEAAFVFPRFANSKIVLLFKLANIPSFLLILYFVQFMQPALLSNLN
jgi:hypothetical protein